MLDKSKAEWEAASAEEKRAAEVVAHAYMVGELEANLIRTEEAVQTVDGHQAEGDETWCRAVYGILIGLRRAGLVSPAATPDGNSLHVDFMTDRAARAI